MIRDRVLQLLREVAGGSVSPEAALTALSDPIPEQPDFATIDHHRSIRQGFPEVVFGEGKSAAQTVEILQRLERVDGAFLVTRADPAQRAAVISAFPAAIENAVARTVRLGAAPGRAAPAGRVLIITAGTSDIPVAEEAVETLAALGLGCERMLDVGVAGIHRILSHRSAIADARAIVVVAGMDGALPSVVGGLASAPVIAVPTSVGYGSSFGGLAALLTMLNSCAAGVTVVNIDNGFGAAVAVYRILHG